MLVKFTSSSAGEIVMLPSVARHLLELMGKSWDERGVITCEQIPEILARLQAAIDGEAAKKTAATDDPDDADAAEQGGGAQVSLARRAFPLIELLQWTQRDEGFILWLAPGAQP